MPTNVWLATVDLGDLFAPGSNPLHRREEIAARVRASSWPGLTTDPGRLEYVLKDLVEAEETFADLRWQTLVTLADMERIWLETVLTTTP